VDAAVAAAVSIPQGLPAKWGKGILGPLAVHGHPTDTLRDWVTWRGTALAPPLVVIVVVVGVTSVALLGVRWACVATAVAGALAVVGYLGEPITRRALVTHFEAGRAAIIGGGLLASLLLVLAGLREARVRPARVA